MEIVKLEKKARVGLITIDNPKSLNALNVATLGELGKIADALGSDEGIRCLVITGSGPKSFVAGADISEMRGLDEAKARELSCLGNSVFRKIELLPMPVIAAVNGYAFGGGCELALACDIRLASSSAVFSFPEVTLGIIPGFGGTQRLPRAVGYSAALRMIASAERISSEKALAMGLVDEVVDAEGLMARAMELANAIGENAPIAVRYAKKAIRSGLEQPIDVGIVNEANKFGAAFKTRDCLEGLTAFLEKRPRKFTNS